MSSSLSGSTTRFADRFIWLHPNDCDPPHSLDMESQRDFNKVRDLYRQFVDNGFNISMPVLIGYPLNGRVQLLTGTHRHMAAKWADITLPVSLRLRSDIERLWGTQDWLDVVKDVPVQDLMNLPVEEGFRIPIHQPVDPSQLYKKE